MAPGFPSLSLSSFWKKDKLWLVRGIDAVRLCREGRHEQLPAELSSRWLLGAERTEAREFAHRTRAFSGSLVACGDALLFDQLRRLVQVGQLAVVRERETSAARETPSLVKQRRVIRALERMNRSTLRFEGRTYRLVADADLGRTPDREDYEVVGQAEAGRVLDGLAKQASPPQADQLGEARKHLTRDWRPPLSPDGLILLRRIAVHQNAVKSDDLGQRQRSGGPQPAEAPEKEEVVSQPCAARGQDNQANALIQASQDGALFCEECEPPAEDEIAHIAVHVQTSASEPVPNVTISVSGGPGGVTDEDGDLDLGDVEPGSYTVSATRDGYTPASTTQTLSAEAGASTQFQLTLDIDQAHLAVHVQDCDGKPVEGVPITLNDEQSMGSTDSDGNLDLGLHPPSTYAVATQTETHANASQELDAVGGADTLFQLELKAKTPTITAKQESYVVVLDSSGNAFAGYPILEFDITDGTPGCFLDVQVQREDAGNLTGGLGLSGSWDKNKPTPERAGQDTFSSWTDGETGLQLDGSGNASYRMPLEWWRDLARQPLSDFTTQTIHFKAATAPSETSSITVDSPVATASVQNNLIDMQVVDNGYINGGLNKSVSMELNVLEANTTEMYTIVQWKTGSNPTWGGPRAYGIVKDYNLNHDLNGPEWAIDRLGTNPRYHDGSFTVSDGGKKATTTDSPGGPIGSADTHDFFALDFDTRVHLNFEVPAAVTITRQEGSPPIWGVVVGRLADPQPVTLANASWDAKILQVRTASGVTVTHPDSYGGP
jgi:hypothetical protein